MPTKLIEVDWDEYMKRCEADKQKIEALQGRPMTVDEQEGLGVMVFRMMQAETNKTNGLET